MVDIPTDLLAGILSKLPVKSLLRFRSVSKTWLCIIQDPKFVKSYKNRPESQIHVIHSKYNAAFKCTVRCSKTLGVNADHRSVDYFPTEFFNEPHSEHLYQSQVVDCVDGLFLFETLLRLQTIQTYLVLWNPSIRRFRILPETPQEVRGRIAMNLGIGFNPWIQDYKHVRLYGPDCVMVYTVGTNSWKTIPFKTKGDRPWCFYVYENKHDQGKLCFGGAMYLLADTVRVSHLREKMQMVSFDLRTEEFSSSDMPELDVDDIYIVTWQLKCVSDGSRLALIGLMRDRVSIWWAQGAGGDVTWSKHYTFSAGNPTSAHGWLRDVLNIELDLSRRGVFLLRFDDSVRLYDVESQEEKILLDKNNSRSYSIDSIIRATPYIESLVLLMD